MKKNQTILLDEERVKILIGIYKSNSLSIQHILEELTGSTGLIKINNSTQVP